MSKAIAQDNISEEIETYSLSDTTIAKEFYNKAKSLTDHAKYDSSIYYLEKTKEIYSALYRTYIDNSLAEGIVRSENLIGWNMMLQAKYENSLQLLSENLLFGVENLGENNIEVAQTINNIGVVYWQQGKYNQAIESYNKSLAINNELFGENNPKSSASYNNLAIIYFDKGDFDRALEYYKKSLVISLELLDEISIAGTYNNIGNTYSRINDNYKALEYFQKSLSIRLTLFGENHPNVATSYSNIGNTYGRIGDYEKTLENNLKALAIRLDFFKDDHPDIAMSYNNIGIAYFHIGDFDQAMYYAEKSLVIKLNLLGERHPLVLSSFIFLGNIHGNLRNFESAIGYYNKALNIGIELYGPNHNYVGECYYLIAQLYEQKDDYENAILFCQKSLSSLVSGFEDQNVQNNPEIGIINPGLDLLNTLALKAQLFLKADKGNLNNNYNAHSTYQLAINLIDKMRTGYKAEGSKLYLRARSSDLYESAIYSCMKLYEQTEDFKYKESAFIIAEKSKSAVLEESLNEVQAKQFSKLPVELLEEEKQLKIDLAFYDTRLQKEYNKKETKDSLFIKEYENLLFDLKVRYENLIFKFEMEFPDYYNLKYQTRTVSISEIQAKLKEETALIEYFVGEKSIYVFIISRNEFGITSIEKPADFSEIVKSFYTSILKTEREEYIISGNKLSEILIIPVLNTPYLTDKKKLVIIPDDIVYKVPFEALFTSTQKTTQFDYSKFDYLLKEFDVSYHYSSTLFSSSWQSEKVDEKNFAGFAPVFPDNYLSGYTLTSDYLAYLANDSDELFRSVTIDGKKFNELKHSEWEVKTIVDLFKQEPKEKQSLGYFYSNATEDNFKTNISKFDIIHIATHSFINETHPQISGIVFAQSDNNQNSMEDGILYAGEIYNLDLNADLVVLSSCESGLGKLIKGEGMMALTRGFLYTGADNVLFSLWKVPDKPTSELMVEFYRNILSGKSYSASLREAKLNLINNSSTSRPRSWASFVLVGGN